MDPVETYLKELRDTRATGAGVDELSYYSALSNLFNEVGKALKPKVRCVMTLRNRGAGWPDGGLFTAHQFRRQADAEPPTGQLPERGAIEAKGVGKGVREIAQEEQVARYVERYGLVLVTTFREFLLVGQDANGRPLPMEEFSLAPDEPAFWRATAHPQRTANEQGERFCEYLRRAMLAVAPLSAPQDVAWFLASYARDARARVEAADLPALAAVREALEQALGMKFTGPKGEHFFRSTLVQTIFYGVFSAWVLWHRQRPDRTDAFNWHEAEWSLHVPFIRTLYDAVATPGRLGPLGLVEVLDWTAGTLNRVDRGAFFARFQDEHAVQYFYEPFLEAFDPELRRQLGVWYTPPEIVQYQVARVDTVLREELHLPDGLADPNVVVLDPCCGTGAYLVEVLRKIGETLKGKGEEALLAADIKRAAQTRVFGFEILPAPFVVAHLQLGLMLHRLGAPLSARHNERVGVYLTNALTGWEPPTGPKQHILPMPELEAERDAAERVKREERILVILGNPPYNAFAGVSPEQEEGLVEPYKAGLNKPVADGGWGIRKFNLDDLYVRFFRLAERRIAEMTGRGVVSFISNHSWLSEPSFVVLRQHLLESFDRFWIENLHGNRKISEYAPDGQVSETVFAIRGFGVGIQQGVATSLWVKTGQPRKGKAIVLFRDDINAPRAHDRRAQLLRSLGRKRFDAAYTRAKPTRANRFSFRPEKVSREYAAWASIADLCVAHYNGPVERRASSLIVHRAEKDRLCLLAKYLDPEVTDEQIRLIQPAFMRTSGEFRAAEARRHLKGSTAFKPECIVSYPFKPLDVRLAYLDAEIHPLFSRPSPELLGQRFPGNAFFVTRDTADKSPEGPPFYFSRLVCDYDCISGHSRHFPLLLMNGERLGASRHRTLFDILGEAPEAPAANLSAPAREYLASLCIKDPDADAEAAGLIWLHALAVGYSPAYLAENADGIRRDWPRVPLPATREALEASAALGRQVAALLDTEADVPGVTAGTVAPLLRTLGVLAKVGGGALDVDGGDLGVTAGWGHAGKGGVTMPGKGKIITRKYAPEELAALDAEAAERDLTRKELLALLGPDTRDVHLNDRACWRNVPPGVWDYYIGGYQVIKKWLSYREQALLGRALRIEEARYVTEMVRRLAALVMLRPALDANYQAVKTKTCVWPRST